MSVFVCTLGIDVKRCHDAAGQGFDRGSANVDPLDST
jgi:hypothetical protein